MAITEAAAAKATTELNEEVQRLEAALAKERTGTCVYAVGPTARSATMTELSCALLNGTWIDGAVGSPSETASTADALTAALQRKLDNQEYAPVEMGVCVYAAGGKVCQAEMSGEQCDLIAGRWFPVPVEPDGFKGK